MQQLDGLLTLKGMLKFHVAAIVRVEILIHAAKGDRMPVGLNLQYQLDEVAQLQRLPEGVRRLVRDNVAVFGDRQQFVAALGTAFLRRHAAGQRGKTLDMLADRLQNDINPFEKLVAMQIVQHRQIDARATFGHFFTQAVEALFQQQREVNRQMRVAGGHIAFGFNNAGGQQRLLFVGEHAIAFVLYRLPPPPWANLVQHALVLFADGKAGTGPVGQIVYFLFNPTDGVFRENGGGADFTGLVADNQLVVLDPDSALRQVMRQRQRATKWHRLVHILLISAGVMLRSLGADRRFNDMYQRVFMRLDAVRQGVEL